MNDTMTELGKYLQILNNPLDDKTELLDPVEVFRGWNILLKIFESDTFSREDKENICMNMGFSVTQVMQMAKVKDEYAR